MKKKNCFPFTTAALASLATLQALSEEGTRLSTSRSQAQLELSWPATVQRTDGSVGQPYFELQRSVDLKHWQPIGERRRAAAATGNPSLTSTVALDEPRAFYRLLAVEPGIESRLGSGGAEVFGYGAAFADQLLKIGQISPDQFAVMFPAPTNYLPGISFDPTTAQYWDQFNADPAVVNAGKQGDEPGFRDWDARLSAPELALFKTNGFVVSERLSGSSFAEVFYNLWRNDLPVFVSTDALLQAWHRTYDAMLEEIEETYLFNSVQTMLDAMAAQVTGASVDIGAGVLKDSLLDADYFVAVARSLLAGTNSPAVRTQLGQDARVAETLADIQAEQLKQVGDFMGFCRMVDFSQFTVRGHYTHSERLGRYFKCLMWLGRIDVPVAGGPWERCPGDLRFTSPRETGFAIVLWQLLNQSGQFGLWADIEQILETFVGMTDSLTFGQLNGLLSGAGIRTLADVPDLATLQKLQNDLVSGQLGVQNIRSDWFQPISAPERYALPQTFTVLGQKFVPDSWAFSQTVFNSILWVENGTTNPVQRRVPGALDVAFSVLGNNQVVPELIAQTKGMLADTNRPHALQFRDGLPYQHNLAAVRTVMDQQASSVWDRNIYMNWLDCLRQLSLPTTDVNYPEAMRTRAWAMKTLNTQLASWTHLRHDTILYAKQSYTFSGGCVYPTGFVEPRVEFWQRLRATASRAAERIASLHYAGTYLLVTNNPVTGNEVTKAISMAAIQSHQVAHVRRFADTVATLQTLSEKELTQACFSADEELFIRNLIQNVLPGCTPVLKYDGWYPALFYRAINWTDFNFIQFQATFGSGAFDALVADVHTDVPNDEPPDPGSVLHEAIGRVNLLMLAVDSGADRFICAGPVLSHYEFEVIGDPRRITDQEWGVGRFRSGGILRNSFPPDLPATRFEGLAPPVWTRSYLVPQ